MNYLLGAAAQYAATSGKVASRIDRTAYLEAFAAELTRIDPDTHEIVTAFLEHRDSAQFLAGIEAANTSTSRPPDY